jgi:putative MATE family efflux protein
MTSKKHIYDVIRLGAPLLAGLVSEFFMYTADSAMVGRLGTEYLAAIAIATLFAEILWVIVWPFAPGTQALAARRFGRQQEQKNTDSPEYQKLQLETGEILDNALIVSFAVGLAAVVFAFFAEDIFELFLPDRTLIPRAASYVRIIKWVMPAAGVFFSLYGFLAAVNLTRVIMVASVSLNLLNIGLNYALIFGEFGMPALGIEGAALGTVISFSLGTVILVAYVMLSKNTRGYRCCRFRNINGRLMKDISVASSPMIAQLAIALCAFLYYEFVVAGIGTVYLAVTHIIFTAFILNRTLVGGFAEGGSILIGNNLGRGDRNEAIRYAIAVECIAILFGIVIVALVFLLPSGIIKVFNQDPETVAIGTDGLKFFVVFLFINSLGYPFETIFTHNGWGKFPLIVECISIGLFVLGLTTVLVKYFHMGIYAAWFAFGLYIICYSVMLTGGFLSMKWLETKVETQT